MVENRSDLVTGKESESMGASTKEKRALLKRKGQESNKSKISFSQLEDNPPSASSPNLTSKEILFPDETNLSEPNSEAL